MKIIETEVGFPCIDGFRMHSQVLCRFPISVTLWFYRLSPDLSSTINIHLFLIGARMLHANVELSPFFPEIASYSVERNAATIQDGNILNIKFERGEMSFSFQESFYVKNTEPLESIPDELKKLMKDS